MDMSYKKDDRIRCQECNKVLLFKELKDEKGHRFPVSYKVGSYWQTIYYYCPCNNKRVMVYDPGDGRDLILVNGEKFPKEQNCGTD